MAAEVSLQAADILAARSPAKPQAADISGADSPVGAAGTDMVAIAGDMVITAIVAATDMGIAVDTATAGATLHSASDLDTVMDPDITAMVTLLIPTPTAATRTQHLPSWAEL